MGKDATTIPVHWITNGLRGIRPHPTLDEQYTYLRVLGFDGNTSSEGDRNVDDRNNNNNTQLLLKHIVIILLDRPQKRNAINVDLWKEIGHVFSTVGRIGDDCRAIILAGSGSSFCSGIDVSDPNFLPQQPQQSDDDKVDVARTGIAWLPQLHQMQECFTALETCPVPVVVAIHGACIGAGIDLVTCADVRLCTTDTVWSIREVALGLAADVGTLQRLPKMVGNQSLVRELCFTGRDFTAAQALAMGLVSRTCGSSHQLVCEALSICLDMVRHSPIAVQGTKTALLYARDHSVADGLAQIASYNALALQGSDVEKAWTARASRTVANFSTMPKYSKL